MVPDILFQRREHAEASIHKFEDEQERLAWFNPGLKGRQSYPTWRRGQEYLRAIHKTALPPMEKLYCYALLPRWLLHRHHTGPRNIRLMAQELTRGLSAVASRWRHPESA